MTLFIQYSFNIDKFVKQNRNNSNFSYRNFSDSQTDERLGLILQCYRPSILNDYESVRVNLFCISNARIINLPVVCNKNKRTET